MAAGHRGVRRRTAVLLGVALLVPTRAHRLVGVLALLVSLATAAAVLVLFVEADWRVERFGVGTWFAVAVPVLGVPGSAQGHAHRARRRPRAALTAPAGGPPV